jgi:hypothetical protein
MNFLEHYQDRGDNPSTGLGMVPVIGLMTLTLAAGCTTQPGCEFPPRQGQYPTSEAPVYSDPGMNLGPTMKHLGSLIRKRLATAKAGESETDALLGRYNFHVDIPLSDDDANTDLQTDEQPYIRLNYKAMSKGAAPNTVGFETHPDPDNPNRITQSASIAKS